MSTTRIDWRKPLAAQGEETYWIEPSEDGSGQPRRSIRWQLSEEGYGRVMRMEACPFCLTGFPAPPRKDTWPTWKASGFGFLFDLKESKRLIGESRCPICKGEISADMLAIQDDTEWQSEDDALKRAAEANLDADREREEFEDLALANRLGLVEPRSPVSRRKTVKRMGES